MFIAPRRSLATGIVPIVLAAALSAVAARALAAPLGSPKMQVLTAKIAPPYAPNFQLTTAFSGWPPLLGIINVREDGKDASGRIEASATWWTSSSGLLRNFTQSFAKDDATFGSAATMAAPFSYVDHSGDFCFVQWSQSFRKDSADASYHYTMTAPLLYTRCLTTGARAEFAVDNYAFFPGSTFYRFHQDAGLLMFGNPPGIPIVNQTSHGPMTYTGSNPDGIQRDYQMAFATRTEVIDLSSVPLGSEFTVVFSHVTQANIAFDEVVRANAFFRDPGNESLGVFMELHGLTPTDAPLTLGVEPLAAAPGGALSRPWPNPARGDVSFALDVPSAGEVAVEVFDLAGRRVASVARGAFEAGVHALSWNARDDRGAPAPSGVYLVRATGPGFRSVRRVVRLASD